MDGEIACGGFVVSHRQAAGVLEPVEAMLDTAAQSTEEVVDGALDFPPVERRALFARALRPLQW